MKKILLAVCIAVFGVCTMSAQKGEKAAGINLNFGTTGSNVGLAAKFQYGFTDAIRSEAAIGYNFGGLFDITANAHYLFNVVPKFAIYSLAGVGFVSYSSSACFKFDIGAGVEYAITDKISAGIEIKYDIITGGWSQLGVNLGATYKF